MSEQASPDYRAANREGAGGAWAVGLIMFASIMMFLVGVFQAFTGLVAIFNDQFLVATHEYLFQFDRTTWGWIHLILGLVVAGAGVGLMAGRTWSRAVAIVLALCSAVTMFAFLPHYPLWALIVITLDVAVIWAVATQGGQAAASR
jgi:hypothetical protein